jgi:hypothetical protein
MLPSKAKDGTTTCAALPLLVYIQRKWSQWIKSMPISVVALLVVSDIWHQPRCISTNEWIKKMCHICVCVCVCV